MTRSAASTRPSLRDGNRPAHRGSSSERSAYEPPRPAGSPVRSTRQPAAAATLAPRLAPLLLTRLLARACHSQSFRGQLNAARDARAVRRCPGLRRRPTLIKKATKRPHPLRRKLIWQRAGARATGSPPLSTYIPSGGLPQDPGRLANLLSEPSEIGDCDDRRDHCRWWTDRDDAGE